MIIEFTGIPGSGKTYIAEKLHIFLQKEYRDKKIIVYNRKNLHEVKRDITRSLIKKLIFYVPFFLNINIVCLIFILFVSSINLSSKLTKLNYFLYILAEHKVIKILKSEKETQCIFILDEGMLHLSEIFIDEIEFKAFNRIMIRLNKITRNWYKSERLFIFVNGDIETSYNRISKREQGWPPIIKNKSIVDKKIYLKQFYNKISEFRKYIHEKNDFISINSNNNGNELIDYFSLIKTKLDVKLRNLIVS